MAVSSRNTVPSWVHPNTNTLPGADLLDGIIGGGGMLCIEFMVIVHRTLRVDDLSTAHDVLGTTTIQ